MLLVVVVFNTICIGYQGGSRHHWFQYTAQVHTYKFTRYPVSFFLFCFLQSSSIAVSSLKATPNHSLFLMKKQARTKNAGIEGSGLSSTKRRLAAMGLRLWRLWRNDTVLISGFSHVCSSLHRSRALLQSSSVSAWLGSRQRAASQSRRVETKSPIESWNAARRCSSCRSGLKVMAFVSSPMASASLWSSIRTDGNQNLYQWNSRDQNLIIPSACKNTHKRTIIFFTKLYKTKEKKNFVLLLLTNVYSCSEEKKTESIQVADSG